MKQLSINFLLLLALSITFTSCSKDDNSNNTQSQTVPNSTPNAPSDADGLLAAVNSIQVQEIPNPTNNPLFPSEIEVEFNVGVGAFFENNDPESLLEAGTVTVNTDNDLEKQSNNSYVSTYDQTSTDGMDLGFGTGDQVDWAVSGGAGASAFNYTTTKRMPGSLSFVGDYSEVDISQSLTVQIDGVVSYADSVLFLLAADNATVQFTGSSNTTSHTFTASEMSVLGGTGVVQVVPFTMENATVGGKNIYFVNEVVITSFTEFK